MISEIFNSKPDKKELRKFAITICAVLSIIGGIILWQKGDTGFIFLAVGLLFLFPGLIKPKLLGPIYKVWMAFALLLGFRALFLQFASNFVMGGSTICPQIIFCQFLLI